MIAVTINMEEFNAFRARLQEMPAQWNSAVNDAMDVWGTQVTTTMKENHGEDAHAMQRYENQTFDLTNSIGHTIEAPDESGGTVHHNVSVFAMAPYAFDIENGVPGRHAAYPFFWKEIFSGTHRDQLQEDLLRRLTELLASVAERS